MLKLFALPLLLALGSFQAFAAPAPQAPVDTPELRQKLAEEILEVTHARETIEGSLAQTQELMFKGAPEDTKAAMIKVLADLMAWDKVSGRFTKLYTEVFTTQELQDISIFYHSPLGKRLIAKQPEITTKTVQMMQDLMKEALPLLQTAMKQPKTTKETESSPAP